MKNGKGDTVLTSAVRSKGLAVVKEVLECVKNNLTNEEVKRSARYACTSFTVPALGFMRFRKWVSHFVNEQDTVLSR